MKPRNERERFIVFLATSGLAALVNLASRYLLNTQVSFEIAVAIAYLIAMTVAFILARTFVFEASGRSLKGEYLTFGVVNAVAFVQVWLVSVGLESFLFPAMDFTWHADTIAHFIGVASPAITSFYGHKHLSFARKD